MTQHSIIQTATFCANLLVCQLVAAGNPVAPFTLSEPPGDGLPSLIVTYPYTPVAGVYNWIAGDTVIPDTTLAQQTVATLSKFNRPLNAPVNESTPLTQKDLIILKRW